MTTLLSPDVRGAAATAAVLQDVGFTYPTGTVALEGLSLDIPAGKVTGVVGPSGCGKSTMLQLLTGLATPTVGTVDLNVDRTSGRHDVAMVFQQDTLLPWLTVAENVGLYYRFHKPKDPAQVERDVMALLEMADIDQFADAYPKQLSGGMRRRAVFLASVAAKPQLLLLDEPFSSVDEPTRVGIHQNVLQIVHQQQMTTVLVTHDLAEAISLSDQVVIFSARPGRIFSVHEIPFGDDRNVLALRDDPAFLTLYGQLWHDLSQQIAKAHEQGDDL
jgi:NitT/TauT family transport system ATP-binding protein